MTSPAALSGLAFALAAASLYGVNIVSARFAAFAGIPGVTLVFYRVFLMLVLVGAAAGAVALVAARRRGRAQHHGGARRRERGARRLLSVLGRLHPGHGRGRDLLYLSGAHRAREPLRRRHAHHRRAPPRRRARGGRGGAGCRAGLPRPRLARPCARRDREPCDGGAVLRRDALLGVPASWPRPSGSTSSCCR